MFLDNLSASVRKVCSARNLGYEAASELCNLSSRYFGSIARGKTAPSIAQAYRIAFYFGLSVDDFIEYGLNSYGIFKNDYKSIVDKYENESENK